MAHAIKPILGIQRKTNRNLQTIRQDSLFNDSIAAQMSFEEIKSSRGEKKRSIGSDLVSTSSRSRKSA